MRASKSSGQLLPLYISIFVTVLGFSLVAPIFPKYATDLGASYTLLGVIISAYGGIQLITQVPIGRLSDRLGRKPFLLMGLMTFALMPPLYIYATNAYFLIPIRLIGGAGASAVWPIAMALIIEQVEPSSRGKAMGWYNAAFYSALAIGPAMGGALYDLFGLAGPFYFWAGLGVISLILVFVLVKEPEKKEAVPDAEIELPKENLVLPRYGITFIACCGVVMWTGVVGGFNITMLPTYASEIGLTTAQIGLLYLAYAGCMATANIYFGRQADRGRRKAMIIAGCAFGAISFALLPEASGLYSAMAILAILGSGAGMSNPSAAALIADTTCTSRRGETFGIFNTSRMMGVVIGPLIAGLTADMYGINGTIESFVAVALTITLATALIREPAASPACTENDKIK
jgi:DHA1 family multidrug resistance protein-like MFS transporter